LHLILFLFAPSAEGHFENVIAFENPRKAETLRQNGPLPFFFEARSCKKNAKRGFPSSPVVFRLFVLDCSRMLRERFQNTDSKDWRGEI
jgi:hypothetical protein